MARASHAEAAYQDFLALGPSRSLTALVQFYREQKALGKRVPTVRAKTLSAWADEHHWFDRTRALDEVATQAMETAMVEAKVQNMLDNTIFSTGYALESKRVEVLGQLAEKLWNLINEDTRLWLLDVKQIGGGSNAERVDMERFNAPLVEQFRKTLADIAMEMGHRKIPIEVDVEAHGEVEHIHEIRDRRWQALIPVLSDVLQEADFEEIESDSLPDIVLSVNGSSG